jgi:hypothetical protein
MEQINLDILGFYWAGLNNAFPPSAHGHPPPPPPPPPPPHFVEHQQERKQK